MRAPLSPAELGEADGRDGGVGDTQGRQTWAGGEVSHRYKQKQEN